MFYIGMILAIAWVIVIGLVGTIMVLVELNPIFETLNATGGAFVAVVLAFLWIVVIGIPACWIMRICGGRHGRTPMADVFDPFDIGLDERYK